MSDIELQLALSLYAEGFRVGSDPNRARRRSVAHERGHEHWRAGFEAGRAAAEAGRNVYAEQLRGGAAS